MPLSPSSLSSILVAAAALLVACRKEVPPPPVPPADPLPRTSSSELPGASDRGNAPPAIGAVTAGQDAGGHSGRPIQPSGGDGTPAASAASRASPP